MVFSRRISTPDGRFKGVIQVGTPMELFENLFKRVEVGTQGTILLADDNGTLLARYPAAAALVGEKVLRDDGVLARLRAGDNASVRINKAPVDGVERMLGLQRAGATRLVVGVGQSVEEHLANWRHETVVAGTVTLLFAALALWLLVRTTQHARHSAVRTAQLAATSKRLRDITDNLPLLISYIDKDLRLGFCNATWRDWLGIDPDAVVGRPLSEVVGPAVYEQRSEQLQRELAGERVGFEVESLALGVDRFLQTEYIPDVRADGGVAGIYALSTDVTAFKKVEMQLSQLAHVDVLTGLPNRRRFEDKLQEAMARSRRDGRIMALMFLDVDHFKRINDTRGHAGGDAVLKEFAARLQRCIRITDTVARLAGDEFVIILEGLHHAVDAERVAHKVRAELLPSFVFDGLTLAPVTASIGVVVFAGGGNVEPADVVAQADDALYRAKRAKRAGRDTFVVAQSWASQPTR